MGKKSVVKIGSCVFIAYCLGTFFSFVAYYLFKLTLIPVFLVSGENALFLMAWGAFMPFSGEEPYVVSVVLSLVIGIVTLAGGFVVLSRGDTLTACLLLATSTLLIFRRVRQLYSKCRV